MFSTEDIEFQVSVKSISIVFYKIEIYLLL